MAPSPDDAASSPEEHPAPEGTEPVEGAEPTEGAEPAEGVEPAASTFTVSLEGFDGPFDLLLNLISQHEMDITEVSLSKVTDEFISYLRGLDEAGLEQASEFLRGHGVTSLILTANLGR